MKQSRAKTPKNKPAGSRLSKWVRGLLWLATIMKIIAATIYALISYLAQVIHYDSKSLLTGDFGRLVRNGVPMDVVFHYICILMLIVFLVWMYKMHSGLRNLNIKTRFSPLAAVVLWIIPVINVISAPLVMAALVQAVRPKKKPGFLLSVPMIIVWWLVVFLAMTARYAGDGALEISTSMLAVSYGAAAMAVSALAYCIAGIMLIALVGGIQKSLNRRIRRAQKTGRADPDSETARLADQIRADLQAIN